MLKKNIGDLITLITIILLLSIIVPIVRYGDITETSILAVLLFIFFSPIIITYYRISIATITLLTLVSVFTISINYSPEFFWGSLGILVIANIAFFYKALQQHDLVLSWPALLLNIAIMISYLLATTFFFTVGLGLW